jgi:hypothetical protein
MTRRDWPESEAGVLVAIRQSGLSVLVATGKPCEGSDLSCATRIEKLIFGGQKVTPRSCKTTILTLGDDFEKIELRYTIISGKVESLKCRLIAGDKSQLKRLRKC